MERPREERNEPAYSPPSRKTIPPFEALRAFDAVARLGGVRQAARSLGRDHAVISRHLKTLVQWTGAKLIERTPSGVALTEDGRRYHREIASAMDSIAASTIDLMRRGYHNHLHISCAPGFALHWMSRRVGMFEKLNPDVEIELRPTDRSPENGLYETDIEIRFVPSYRTLAKPAPGMQFQEVATVPIIAVASAEYLASAPANEKPADLVGQRLLHEYDFDTWAHWLAAHGVYDELDLTGPRLWQGHLTLDAAIHGRGVALINYLIADSFLQSGELIEVGKGNPAFQPYAEGKYLIYSRADRWDTPLIRRYRRWLIDTLGKRANAA
jgi:DNA-binding transcriptional LysR family regulator